MGHTIFPTFVITNFSVKDSPTQQSMTIRHAYHEALELAKHQTAVPYAEIAVGGHSHQLIRGREPQSMPRGEMPQQTLLHRQYDSPYELETHSTIDATPLELLLNNYAPTDPLVSRELLNLLDANSSDTMSNVLIAPDGSVVHHPLVEDTDVFGQTRDDADSGTLIAARYYKNSGPDFAHYHARHPLYELHRAQYRCEYLRTLAKYPGNIAVQLEMYHR